MSTIRRASLTSLLVAMSLWCLTGAVHARDGVIVSGAWSRALPPVVKTGAAYLRLTNTGTEADKLVDVQASIAERAELHEHAHVNGMMQMRKLHAVEVPARGTVSFAPHGLHIMLLGLRQPLDDGSEYRLTLRFASGQQVDIDVPVRREAP